MKPFHKQFCECSKQGLHGQGEFKKFKDHLELLPPPWHKAVKTVAEKLKENPDAGLQFIACLRFGGTCRSSHPECRKLRQ